MENTFLLRESGKEDYYEFVGTREDLNNLFKNEVTYVLYPNQGGRKNLILTYDLPKNTKPEINEIDSST